MVTIETAHQGVGASRAELRVSVDKFRVEFVIAGRQLDAKVHASRKIGRKSGIKAFNANIAKLTPTIGSDLARIVLRKGSKIVWHLHFNPPALVEQILQAEICEVSLDFLIVIVRRRRRRTAAPVLILVLEIVIDENHRTGVIREHRVGSDIKDVTPAGTAPHRANEDERGHY